MARLTGGRDYHGAEDPRGGQQIVARQVVREPDLNVGLRRATGITSYMGKPVQAHNVYIAGPTPPQENTAWTGISKTLSSLLGKAQKSSGLDVDAGASLSGVTGQLNRSQQTTSSQLSTDELKSQDDYNSRLQALVGVRLGNEINRSMREKITLGQIKNAEEANGYVDSIVEPLSASLGQEAYLSMYAGVTDGIKRAGEVFNDQLKADSINTGRDILTSTALTEWRSIGSIGTGAFRSAISEASKIARESGVDTVTVNDDLFDSGLAAINEALDAGDVINPMLIAEEMRDSGIMDAIGIRGSLSGKDIVLDAIRSGLKRAEESDTLKDDMNRIQVAALTKDSYNKWALDMEGTKSIEDLQKVYSEVTSLDPDELVRQFGTYGANVETEFELNKARILGLPMPDSSQQWSEVLKRIADRDPVLLQDPTVLYDYRMLTASQRKQAEGLMNDAKSEAYSTVESLTNMHVQSLKDVSKSMMETDATTGAPLGFGRDGTYVASKLRDAYYSVNNEDPKYKTNPGLLAVDRSRVMQIVADNIKKGVIKPYDPSEEPKGEAIDPLTVTSAQYLKNPEARKALEDYIAPSGSNLIQRLGNLNDIQDPELKRVLSKDLIYRDAVQGSVQTAHTLMRVPTTESDDTDIELENALIIPFSPDELEAINSYERYGSEMWFR